MKYIKTIDHRKTFISLLLAAFFILSNSLHAQAPVLKGAESYLPFPHEWQVKLDAITETGETPGVIMMVESPRWGIRVGKSGYANIAEKTELNPSIHYRIGSVSKLFTAVTVLSLEQDGLLRLDDTLDKYLTGDLALAAGFEPQKITIRDCLQHTGGLDNYLATPFFDEIPYKDPALHVSPAEIMRENNLLVGGRLFAPGDTYANPFKILFDLYLGKPVTSEDVHAPGSFPQRYPWFLYSNSGYHCLGIVIEKVTGKKIEQVMKERVMDKLKLKNTIFATDQTIPSPMARGYSKLNARQKPIPPRKDWVDRTVYDPSYAWAAGAVISTPEDILSFMKGIFTTETVLDKATKEKWFRFVTGDTMIPHMDYGVGGLMQVQADFGMLRGHGGAIPGFLNSAFHMPDTETTFVIMINTWDNHLEIAAMNEIMPLVLNSVTSPRPRNGGSVALDGNDATLHFRPGRAYGKAYRVYVSEDRATLLDRPQSDVLKATVKEGDRSCTVCGLSADKTYYWRVDTLIENDEQTIPGPIWTFQTN